MTADNGTERLVIHIMERQDIESLRLLHNDDATLAVLTDITHVSEAQQEAWYQSVSTSKTSRRYVARLRSDDTFVGMFRIDQMDMTNRNCFVGCDIVPALRGQGYATEFFTYILNYLFDQYGMHRVQLVTLHSNSVAIGLYKKLGFVEEGISREAIYRQGQWHDLIQMGLLDPEWRKVQG